MLSAEKNKLVTETGRGTPAGDLLRRYWQPAALSEELEGERPIAEVRLLGEDLVLFRDQSGRPGLLARHCCHRGADLCYGRLEDGGLRCPFHGWLYDVDGKCLEQPAEPEGSNFHNEVRQPAYPVREHNGIIFAWLGPGDPPPFPDYDCFAAPDSHSFAFKGYLDCNWLQAVEVGIDPAHASYLHRFFEDEDPAEGYARQFRGEVAETNMPVTRVLREFSRPEIDVETTAYGLRLAALRRLDELSTHVRITNLAFPNAFIIPMSKDMVITQWHVPIDDTRNWWYAFFTSYRDPVDKQAMRDHRLEHFTVPGYMPKVGKADNYGFDPKEQQEQTYTGMGFDINVHDQWAVESPGPIQDRTREHLGFTDKAIIANRKMLMRAIAAVENGDDPKLGRNGGGNGFVRPVAIDAIDRSDDWQACWQQSEKKRRETSPWASQTPLG